MQKSPTEQGFADRSFDLIIAANTIGDPAADAAAAILSNIRQLLRPGGRLLLSVSVPNDEPGGDGVTAKDRALSQWDARLQSHGFSGIDALAQNSHDISSPFMIFATQVIDECVSLLRDPLQHTSTGRPVADLETLTIIGGRTDRTRRLVEGLAALCEPRCKRLKHIESIEGLLGAEHDVPTIGSSVLCITDLDEPLLKDVTAEKLDALKLLFQHARNVLWVCQGARSHEPYSAMMFGLSRSIRAEYANLNLQMLDVDSVFPKATASTVASVFLRLQIWDSWVRQGAQGDVVWSVERELVIEQGRVLIPRLYPKESSNLRYNTARRSISSEVDPRKAPIQLGPIEAASSSSSSSSTSLTMPVPQEIPKLKVPTYLLSPTTTVQITHCLFPFIRLDGVGSVMLCAGTDTSTGAPVFSLGFSASSPAPTVGAWTVPQSGLNLDDTVAAGGLSALGAFLVAQQILVCAPAAVGTVLVHEADPALARALRRGACAKGISLVLTSSKSDGELGEHVLQVKPKLSKSCVRRMVPRSTSVFVDLSISKTDAQHSDASSLIRSCLPSNSDILQRSRFYSSEVQASHHGAVVQKGHAALQAAVEDAANLLPAALRKPVVVPLSKITATVEPSPCPVVLDWTEASVPVELLPVDDGTIFRPDKTYVFVGLSGDLGQSLVEWMVRRGARNIVLSSRHPTVEPKFLEALSREWGAVVKVLAL